jgi:tetratricopeptide (TPR) repeat protein
LLGGRIREFERFARSQEALARERGAIHGALGSAIWVAYVRARLLGDRAGALRALDSALARYPLSTMTEANRPYNYLGITYAAAGRPDLGKPIFAAGERRVAGIVSARHERDLKGIRTELAVLAGDGGAALRAWMEPDTLCTYCRDFPYWAHLNPHALLGEAWDLAGNADSALAHFQRFVERTKSYSGYTPLNLATAYKRIGELAEAKGDDATAMAAYEKFIELWKDADPELQPRVTDARGRLRRLREKEASRR